MPTGTRPQVLEHIRQGRTVDWIAVATGWKRDSIVNLAETNGWKLIAGGTFRELQPAPQPPAIVMQAPQPGPVVILDPTPVTGAARDPLDDLLARAAKSVRPATVKLGERLAQLRDELVAAVDGEEEAVRARAEVDRLEQFLREARAKAGLGAGKTNPNAKAVRAWARDNGVDCPRRGVLPARVVDAWRAAQDAA
jgi:hypothetical protein